MPQRLSFSIEGLLRHAGQRVFDRGEGYFRGGRITALHQAGDRLGAVVHGTHPYSVSLSTTCGPRGELSYACNCPMGVDGECCKHVVALGLTALHMAEKGNLPTTSATSPNALNEYLENASASQLRRWLQIALETNEQLRMRIVASTLTGKKRLAQVDSAFESALRVFDYLEWEQVPVAAQRIEGAIALVDDALQAGEAVPSKTLKSVLERLRAVEEYFTERSDLFDALYAKVAEMHAKARSEEKGDIAPLLDWLVEEVRRGSYEVQPVLTKYAQALGPAGQQEYCERIAQARAAEREALSGLRDIFGASYYPNGADVTALQLELERCTHWQHPDDISAMVAVMGAAGSALSQHRVFDWLIGLACPEGDQRALSLARGLLEAGAMSEALATKMAALFQRLGLEEDLTLLGQVQLDAFPSADTYFWLQQHMPDSVGEKLTRALIAKLKRSAHGSAAGTAEYRRAWDELFRVYLARKEADQVWEIYRKGLVSERWGADVVALRGQTHPDEAVELCWELLPVALRHSDSQYAEPARLVAIAAGLRMRQRQRIRLEYEIAQIRAEHKRKRNFMKRLDELGV